MVGLAVNLWISIGAMLYGKSALRYNLPIGTSCVADNVTTPVTEVIFVHNLNDTDNPGLESR